MHMQSANTGSHEVGHNLGLRHHDSIAKGVILESDLAAPAPGLVLIRTDVSGTGSTLRTMASGASVGKTLEESATLDSFFSERSAIKLALALGFQVPSKKGSGKRPGKGKRDGKKETMEVVNGTSGARFILFHQRA